MFLLLVWLGAELSFSILWYETTWLKRTARGLLEVEAVVGGKASRWPSRSRRDELAVKQPHRFLNARFVVVMLADEIALPRRQSLHFLNPNMD